jgi:uncharacterized membrane protein YeaQ/YmgE (transglycosylase-associated protein family)
MSELVLLAAGLVLCFAGARSLKLTVLVGGFALSWLLADAFSTSTATTLLVAVVGAIAALVLTLVVSRMVTFVVGAVIGAVVGARLFALLGGDHPSWLLAAIFVASSGLVCGFLAQRVGRGFLRWGTAFAGAAIIMSAVGSILSDGLGLLEQPHDTTQSTLHTLTWLVLAVVGQQVQRGLGAQRG